MKNIIGLLLFVALSSSTYAALSPGTVTPSYIIITSGTSPGLLTANPATGGTCNGAYNYLWQQSSDGITFATAGGTANGQNYTPGSTSAKTFFRRRVICGTDTSYTNVAIVDVGTIPATADLSYVRSKGFAQAGITDLTVAGAITDPTVLTQSTDYVDGFGRLVQTVRRQATPQLKDLVKPVLYDGYEREVTQLLPYVSSSNDGNYKTNMQAEQIVFNVSQFPNEQFYYGQTEYEASPLDRPLAVYASGKSWLGSGRGGVRQYLLNTAADSVRIWNIAINTGSLPSSTGMYGAGLLYKNVAMDEQNKQVVEYKDKQNRIILKKNQLWDTPAAGHSGWLCTYYIYDDLENLRFVIQPKAVEWLSANSWVFGGTYGPLAINELCFRYEYDTRKRMIIKKVPAAGEVWMVYDARDRLVMSQDANLRTQSPAKWMVTEYDGLNRPYRTGLLTDANDRTYHQNLAYNSITYPSTSANYEVLTQIFYDNYSWVSSSGSGLGASMASNHTQDGNLFYTAYNTSPTYAVPMTSYTNTTGMATGSMTKVLASSPAQYLYAVSFYDDHGRVIQAQRTNYRNGIDTVTTQYDFSGKPLRTLLGHKKAGIDIQYHTVSTKMGYDAAGRLKNILKNIDGTGDQLIDSIQYDELGQLKNKYLGNLVDSLAYAYNIRGWLTSINKSYVTSTSSYPRNYFGMELGYDGTTDATGNGYANPAFNGNISGMIWKGGGDGINRKYDFTYDNVSRLTGADFNQYTGIVFNKSAGVDFSVSGLSYDANGNILSMKQRGITATTSATIDSLSYSYNFSGISNRLLGVTDGTNNQNSTLGDFHYNPNGKGSVDYTYDQNGNMITDFNKGISPITYNHLNLPQKIHIKSKGDIIYTYDAGGNKLAKVTMDSLSKHATTTVYMNGFVYQQGDTIISPNAGIDTLQFVGQEEGRARWAFHRYVNGTTGYKWEYDFFEKDHLGNTREVLTQQRDTAQYMATMEAAYRATENKLFYNVPQSNVWSYYVNGSSGPNPFGTTVTNPNDSVCRLNGNTPHEGPAIILKVMAGDLYRVGVNSFWKSGQTSTGTTDATTDVLSSLANGIISMVGGAKGDFGTLSNSSTSPLLGGVNAFRNDKNPTPPVYPKAYLNYIALDNQFNYDQSASGALGVGAADNIMSVATDTIRIKKNGYLYIYLLNETKSVSVFFDNLSVTHYTGPLLEETQYYPFGLTMGGISDKALKVNYAENKYRYNKGSELQNKEFSDGSGLEMYETPLRSLDPQLGRWWQIDPKPDYAQSLYAAMGNNPVLFNDVLGDTVRVPLLPTVAPKIDPGVPVGWEPPTPPTGTNPSQGEPGSGGKSPKRSNEDKNPLVGVTNTTKQVNEASAGSDIGLGVITVSNTTAVKKGTAGTMLNIDISQKSTNGGPAKLDGVTISSGPVSLKIGSDISITGTLSVPMGNGNDVHVSVGTGKGIGQYGGGLGHKESSGVSTSSDISARPGLSTAGVVALGIVLALNPELTPLALKLATQ